MSQYSRRSSPLTCVLFLVTLLVVAAPPVGAEDLVAGVDRLAEGLAKGADTNGRIKVAILEFSDISGYRSALGRFLAEELVTALASLEPPRFEVIERSQLAKVLAEQKLSESSLLDPETVVEIGKILGIQGIVTGSLADLGATVRVNARLISAETASILSAVAVSFDNEGTVKHLLRQSVGIPSGTSEIAPPAERGTVERKIQASDVFFENDVIRATVQSVGRSEDKKLITLALQVQNLLSTDLMIAMEGRYSRCKARVVDDRGNSSSSIEVSGISCIHDGSEDMKKGENYTRLAAGSRTTIVMVLEVQHRQLYEGEMIHFGSNFYQLTGERFRRFSVGISNIQIFD